MRSSMVAELFQLIASADLKLSHLVAQDRGSTEIPYLYSGQDARVRSPPPNVYVARLGPT